MAMLLPYAVALSSYVQSESDNFCALSWRGVESAPAKFAYLRVRIRVRVSFRLSTMAMLWLSGFNQDGESYQSVP